MGVSVSGAVLEQDRNPGLGPQSIGVGSKLSSLSWAAWAAVAKTARSGWYKQKHTAPSSGGCKGDGVAGFPARAISLVCRRQPCCLSSPDREGERGGGGGVWGGGRPE